MTQPSRIAGLIPAAGSSQRLGHDKRRVSLGSQTVIERTVHTLVEGGLEPVIVVLEPHSPCRDLAGLSQVTLVENPNPAQGMLASIRCGLRHLTETQHDHLIGTAIQPADHAFAPPEYVLALRNHFLAYQPLLLAPRYGQRRGHPLFIHRRLFDEAIACDDAVGLRQLVHQHESQMDYVPLPDTGAEDDIDTPEDLERLKGR